MFKQQCWWSDVDERCTYLEGHTGDCSFNRETPACGGGLTHEDNMDVEGFCDRCLAATAPPK